MRPDFKAFVSYSSEDRKYVDELVNFLEMEGINCWIAHRDISLGVLWPAAIMKALRECDLMILVISKHSNNSKQVVREVERLVNREITIMPVLIEDIKLSDALEYLISSQQWFHAFDKPKPVVFSELVNFVKSKYETEQWAPTVVKNDPPKQVVIKDVPVNTQTADHYPIKDYWIFLLLVSIEILLAFDLWRWVVYSYIFFLEGVLTPPWVRIVGMVMIFIFSFIVSFTILKRIKTKFANHKDLKRNIVLFAIFNICLLLTGLFSGGLLAILDKYINWI